jgi:acetylornithine deacetylase/succinyl-diaminopimelate desuccinylase-like protein
MPVLGHIFKAFDQNMKELKKYLDANKQRFLDELLELLRIPSVSADPKYAGDVRRMAEATAQHLKAVGVDNVEVCNTAGHPIVYGEKMVDPKAPTVLVYGHYDVQPADPLNLWDSPPFEPVVKKPKPPTRRHFRPRCLRRQRPGVHARQGF